MAAAYGAGTYRRRIRIVTRGPRRVEADLEDDFHRFGVWLEHDGERVVAGGASAVRYPWETCPGARPRIAALAGTPLVASAADLALHTDPRVHCTHLYDLAALAMAHAAAGDRPRERTYDVAVPDRVDDRTAPSLARDGEALLRWEVAGARIRGPAPFERLPLVGRGFLEGIRSRLEPDLAEAALVLRRAIFIAIARAHDLDRTPTAEPFVRMGSACHSMQPHVVHAARRVVGSSRDFSDAPERLLRDADP